MATEICVTCGRHADRDPSPDCERPDWHDAPDDVEPEPHSVPLDMLTDAAHSLHAIYCKCGGYSLRELKVVMDVVS